MTKILFLCNDLFFTAKVRTSASKLGRDLVVVTDKDSFLDEIEHKDIDKIIIDLNFSKFDVLQVMETIDTSDIYTIGFLSHTQYEMKEKAEKEIDLVLARKDFSERLSEILS